MFKKISYILSSKFSDHTQQKSNNQNLKKAFLFLSDEERKNFLKQRQSNEYLPRNSDNAPTM